MAIGVAGTGVAEIVPTGIGRAASAPIAENVGDAFGTSVAVGGDFDGDGTDDVAIGSTGYDTFGYPTQGNLWLQAEGADLTEEIVADICVRL